MNDHLFESFINSLEDIRYGVINTIKAFKIDDNYIKNIRLNIKKKMSLLIDICLPLKIIEDKRFIALIDKKKNYDNFRCPICMLILYKPVKTECSHIFCKECIEEVLKKFDFCPLCRSFIKDGKLENVSVHFLGSEYENIKIRCTKCRNITTIKNYENHLLNESIRINTDTHTASKSTTTTTTTTNNNNNNNTCAHSNTNTRIAITGTTTATNATSIATTTTTANNDKVTKTNLCRSHFQNYSNTFDKNLDALFNKKLKIEEINEFMIFLNQSKLVNSIQSFSLLYGEKKRKEYFLKNRKIEEIACETFLIVKIKKKKRKIKIASNKWRNLYNHNKLSKTDSKKDLSNSCNNTKEDKKKTSYIYNTIYKRRFYSSETYELYREKAIKKNETNKYMFVLFEYNSKNIFFTLFNNLPDIKNLHKVKLVTYKKIKKEQNDDYKINELMEFFSILKNKKNTKTYHKYFYNALHLFHEVVFSYTRNGYFLKKKVHHFKNNYIGDYELMFSFFYLKYAYKVPKNVEYHLLHSKELIKKMIKEEVCDTTVFVREICSYKFYDENENDDNNKNNGNEEHKGSYSYKKRNKKNDLNIYVILKVQSGKLKNKLNEKEAHNSFLKDIENYHEVNDICYFIFSYSSKGFHWNIKKSVSSLIKKKTAYESIKVFFDIQKLILFFFHIRNKKYNSNFWNVTHFLHYMIQFCCE